MTPAQALPVGLAAIVLVSSIMVVLLTRGVTNRWVAAAPVSVANSLAAALLASAHDLPLWLLMAVTAFAGGLSLWVISISLTYAWRVLDQAQLEQGKNAARKEEDMPERKKPDQSNPNAALERILGTTSPRLVFWITVGGLLILVFAGLATIETMDDGWVLDLPSAPLAWGIFAFVILQTLYWRFAVSLVRKRRGMDMTTLAIFAVPLSAVIIGLGGIIFTGQVWLFWSTVGVAVVALLWFGRPWRWSAAA